MLSSQRIWAERWLPLLVWCALVQYFSTDAFAWEETSRLVTPLMGFFFPGASSGALALAHITIRKLGHVGEFMVLGWLVDRALWLRSSRTTAALSGVAFVLAFAMLDEWHQIYTLTREGSLIDVGFDSLGGALGIALTSRKVTRR